MDKARILHTLETWMYSRPGIVVRSVLYALVAGLFGWQLGRALASSSSALVASTVFMGICILITLKYTVRGLLLALILHPFDPFFYLYIDLGSGIPDITLTRAIVAITFTLILARGATNRRPFAPLTWVDVAMILAGIGLGIAAVRGVSITTELQWLFDMYLTPYMIYYVTKTLTTDRPALKRVLWSLAFIGAYNGVYGIYTVTTGNVLFVGAGGAGDVWYTESLRAMKGLLGSPYVFGLVFSLAIPVDFYLLIKARTWPKKALSASMLAITMAGLFFTYKRTAWIATLSSLVVIMFFFPRFRRLLLVLLVVVGGAVALYSEEVSESAVATERVGHKTDSLNGRLDLWDAALTYWKQAPVFGYGFGQFMRRSGIGAIESNYLWILVDAGLVGFVPFIMVLVAILVSSVRLFRAREPDIFVERDLVAVFWGSFAAYIVCLSTVVMNHEFPHSLCFLLAGAVVGSQEAILAHSPTASTLAL